MENSDDIAYNRAMNQNISTPQCCHPHQRLYILEVMICKRKSAKIRNPMTSSYVSDNSGYF